MFTSADLVAKLVADPERAWAEWGKNGKPLTQNQLARLLKPFHIVSETVHPPGRADAKGYKRSSFRRLGEAIPGQNLSSSSNSAFKASKRPNADEMGTSCDFQSVQEHRPDGSKNANLSQSHAGLDAWTDRKHQSGAPDEFGHGAKARLCDHCGSPATPVEPLPPLGWPARSDGTVALASKTTWADSGAVGDNGGGFK